MNELDGTQLNLLFSNSTNDVKSENNKNIKSILLREHYIDKELIDENFVFCPVCMNVLDRPVCLDGCRHMFCETCFKNWLEKNDEDDDAWGDTDKKCPVCKIKFKKYCRSESHELILKNIKFKCPYEGCSYCEKEELLSIHLEKCEFGISTCKICKIEYMTITPHYIDCILCGKKECSETIDEHQENICPNAYAYCEYNGCNTLIKRCEMNLHNKICKKEKVRDEDEENIINNKCQKCKKKIKPKNIENHTCGSSKRICRFSSTLNCFVKLSNPKILEHERDIDYHLKLFNNYKKQTEVAQDVIKKLGYKFLLKNYTGVTINDLYLNMKVDILDGEYTWEPGYITLIYRQGIKVSFTRWDHRWDRRITKREIPFMIAFHEDKMDRYRNPELGMRIEYRPILQSSESDSDTDGNGSDYVRNYNNDGDNSDSN
ncbi:MAG: tnf receptor-associated factor 4b [Edafosvirus sp.]|uniref:Tnf receptor-associated factor 4b n=1 Tax=Edafosvirus sp. TaxID=2487765 RepID=A0A3G4ZUE1_9VIRU|nr:MAG: tnf receptor-associated factor 4b [Edafosvirus sp.]